MFFSVTAVIASLCLYPATPDLSAKDRALMSSYQHNACVYKLNKCVRKELNGHLIGWTSERKEEALSSCVDSMGMFKEHK